MSEEDVVEEKVFKVIVNLTNAERHTRAFLSGKCRRPGGARW